MDVDGDPPGPSRGMSRPVTEDDEDVFEEATNLESKFFQEGYDSGFAHGKLHGLFEGRALGQEKGFEVWEELGFYEGFAQVCLETLAHPSSTPDGADVAQGRKNKDARAIANAQALLALIESFPTSNPTPAPSTTSTFPPSAEGESATPQAEAEPDLAGLMSAIRAKYRLLCTSVGARPRLQTAPSTSAAHREPSEGVEGPIKGVDYSALRY